MRSLRLTVAGLACVALLGSGTASATTQTKFPSDQAACAAKAWVPANTDPAEPALSVFIRDQARTGEWGQVIRQQGCK